MNHPKKVMFGSQYSVELSEIQFLGKVAPSAETGPKHGVRVVFRHGEVTISVTDEKDRDRQYKEIQKAWEEFLAV